MMLTNFSFVVFWQSCAGEDISRWMSTFWW